MQDKLVLELKATGGEDAFLHVQRLIKTAEEIGVGLTYDRAAFWYAAQLHDWGAFPEHRAPGVEHALRSRQLAENILPASGLSNALMPVVLEAIELHHYTDLRPVQSIEALLLREVDWLDFLGSLGVARALQESHNGIRAGLALAERRRDAVANRFTIPAARDMGRKRIAEMNRLLVDLLASLDK